MWDTWETVFIDGEGTLGEYTNRVFLVGVGDEVRRPTGIGFQAVGNVLYLGSSDYVPGVVPKAYGEHLLKLNIDRRYRDVDVRVDVEIIGTGGDDESHWFGIAVRAVEANHGNAYLFYVRSNGNVDFAMHRRVLDVKEKVVPEISQQRVVIRIKAERDAIETWVNGKKCYEGWDKDEAFVRRGDIYLIAYAVAVKIYAVEVKTKKWYVPIKRFWVWVVGVVVFLGGVLEFVVNGKEVIQLAVRFWKRISGK